ncbi:MAG TPA: cell division protein FtsZ [Janthinobacterium sp.]|nr:cell division protein FtsZ [Janthinobacterium sp.]
MLDLENVQPETVIKVVGVGGAGGNAVNHMVLSGTSDIEFICVNTDAQALSNAGNAVKIQLGETGLGAGSDPVVGRETALRQRSSIATALKGAHMVFITAGMGGGTGTGAAPVVAEVAREMGLLTVGVVSKPFEFEGARRMRVAEEGIHLLSKTVDSLIIVLNSRLEEVMGDDITQRAAFRAADEVLSKAVSGISEIINVPGMINVDFEDVRTVMREMGTAMMGTATHSGEDRALKAAEEAISCPLLDGMNLHSAQGLLVNIAASEESLKLRETKQVMNLICAQTHSNTIIKFGAVFDGGLGDAMRVTVIATGVTTAPESGQGTAQPHAPKIPGGRPLSQHPGATGRFGNVRDGSALSSQRLNNAIANAQAAQAVQAATGPQAVPASPAARAAAAGVPDLPSFMRQRQKVGDGA